MEYSDEQEERIGEFLIRMSILTEKQVADILAAQKKKSKKLFGEIGIELEYLSDEDVKNFFWNHRN